MTNYQLPYGQGQAPVPFNSFRQIQEMFPQPQGSVYSINAPTEIGNVPIGSTGLSVAICFPDELMYIKSFQNGNPVIMAYRVTPYSREEKLESQQEKVSAPTTEERLTKLEKQLTVVINSLNTTNSNVTNNTSDNGGKFDGLL